MAIYYDGGDGLKFDQAANYRACAEAHAARVRASRQNALILRAMVLVILIMLLVMVDVILITML